MRLVRALLVVAGGACVGWGVWLMRELPSAGLVSEVTWLIGGLVVHDALLAPVVVLIGVAASRILPSSARRPAASTFVVWGTLTIVFLPVLSGQGGKPGNDTILGRPYVLSWAVMTLLLVGWVAWSAVRRAPRS